MDKKQRFFIYSRGEFTVLILLAVSVAVFGFTLGLHLGKSLDYKGVFSRDSGKTKGVETHSDVIPTQREIREQMEGVEVAAEALLDKEVKGEVNKRKLRLNNPKQIKLPTQTKSKNAGATDLSSLTQKIKDTIVEAGAKMSSGESAGSPAGKFTIQVGSYPSVKEASDQVDQLRKEKLKAFVRSAMISGKGRWYRVYVGGYPTAEEATKTAGMFKDEKKIASYIVVKMP